MKVFLIAILLSPASLVAQKLPVNKSGRICFAERVEAPGISQQALKEKALKVIAIFFSYDRDVKFTATPGSLFFKGYSFYHLNKIGIELPYFFHFTLKMNFENGAYNYTIKDFIDDEGVPLEIGLLNAKEIYTEKGEVRPEKKEVVHNISTGLMKMVELLKTEMKE